ncbi:MAG: HypC/HybG/HupF family hydrogenase formation chaperone [Candidatus Latescibacteria bacterium]|nr:HypC/HybG/HupF family hydrogenase formation chaperone [Candidatus Latescibacterota bacterium]
MCLAVPMRLVRREGDFGVAEVGGIEREIGLQLVDEVAVGDFVIVHAGFAIQKLDEEAAQETLALFEEMARLDG